MRAPHLRLIAVATSACTDPIGRPVHIGPVCTNGTACVATGQDRRLGEIVTLATDARPLFTVEMSGPSLRGGRCHG